MKEQRLKIIACIVLVIIFAFLFLGPNGLLQQMGFADSLVVGLDDLNHPDLTPQQIEEAQKLKKAQPPSVIEVK